MALRSLFFLASLLLLSLLFGQSALAHGGMYRGPFDPRNPGKTPGTPGKGFPRPTGPTTPSGPSTLSASGWTDWQLWWELHKDPFLRLRERIWAGDPISGQNDFELGRGLEEARRGRLPSEELRLQKALPALAQILEEKREGFDLFSATLIALGKADGGSGKSVPYLVDWLGSRHQELQESAALALGMTGSARALETLIPLAQDGKEARGLVKDKRVSPRTRAFAIYGLGLIAEASRHPGVLERISNTLVELIGDRRSKAQSDALVATFHAIRLFPFAPGRPAFVRVRETLRTAVWERLAGQRLSQAEEAHAWPCLGRLVGRGGDTDGTIQKVLLRRVSQGSNWLVQSAILCLGEITRPEDGRTLQVLKRYATTGTDRLGRCFAWIALGRIGGADNREFLLQRLASRKTRKLVRPWIAFGAALLARQSEAPDKTAQDLVLKKLKESKNARHASGLALSLSLLGAADAGAYLLERLDQHRTEEEPAGHLALAVGLLRYSPAKPQLEALVRGSLRRPRLLSQSAIALALLDGDGIRPLLGIFTSKERHTVATYAGLAEAIGFVGEASSVEPLLALAQDKERQPLVRAFAVAALGRVLSTRPLPWNSPIGIQTNYAAQVPTLQDGQRGILDIL